MTLMWVAPKVLSIEFGCRRLDHSWERASWVPLSDLEDLREQVAEMRKSGVIQELLYYNGGEEEKQGTAGVY